jgi:hypothetical protein
MSLPTEPVSPKATPRPPIPAEDPLTPSQWKTLFAINDAVVPAIKPTAIANVETEIAVTDSEYSDAISTIRALVPENDPDADRAAQEYLVDYASSNPAYKLELRRLFAMYMPHSTRNDLGMILNLLKYVYLNCVHRHFLERGCQV